MYLLSQLWWYLLLAFLLGALVGYLFWRMCFRPLLENGFNHKNRELNYKLSLLEKERSQSSNSGSASIADTSTFKADLATANAAREQAEARLKDVQSRASAAEMAAGEAQRKLLEMTQTIERLKANTAEQHAADLIHAREGAAQSLVSAHQDEIEMVRKNVAAEWSERSAADVRKAREEAAAEARRRHDDELKKMRDEVTAEWTAKHAADVKKAREEAAQSLAAAHAEDLKKLSEAAKSHETKVIALTQSEAKSDSALKQDLESAKAGHAGDLKKMPEQTPGGLLSKQSQSDWRQEGGIGDRPQDTLKGPRNGQADDLKLIWGVGPKLEKLLNEAGFWHFDQIAKWTDKDIAWIDTQLGEFAGRAVRDKWVDQCKKLATGWRPENEAGSRPV